MLPTLTLAIAIAGGHVATPRPVIDFPAELRTPVGVHVLTGTGVRTRTVFKVKVYTFGLYVDPERARGALAAWQGKSAGDLAADGSLYNELLKGSFPMSIRLEMARDVGAEQMAEAFDGALAPRIADATRRGSTGGAEALARFRSLFTTELKKDSELIFTWAPGDRLLVSIGGRQVGEIENRALAWALFDVYLGAQPISVEGKRSVVSRLPSVLSR